MGRWWGGAIAAPGIVIAVVVGMSGVSSFLAGEPLMLAPVPTSLAEAAGNRDAAEVMLRLEHGEDINRGTLVRIPQRFSHPLTLTPLEAAVASERTYMIDLVRDHGAWLDAPTLRRLRCFAERRKDRGTIAYLSRLDPSPLRCQDVEVPE